MATNTPRAMSRVTSTTITTIMAVRTFPGSGELAGSVDDEIAVVSPVEIERANDYYY